MILTWFYGKILQFAPLTSVDNVCLAALEQTDPLLLHPSQTLGLMENKRSRVNEKQAGKC